MASFRTAGFSSFRSAFQPFRISFRNQFSKRWQSVGTGTASSTGAEPVKEKLNPFSWNSPVGPKTVHFWAPIMKWAIVGATVSDFVRPAEQLSLEQSGSLVATGAIWTRWCLIIKPKNYLLAAVNFFLFLANGVQVVRIYNYRSTLKDQPVATKIQAAAAQIEDSVQQAAKNAKERAGELANKVSR